MQQGYDAPIPVYCNMKLGKGGWTLVLVNSDDNNVNVFAGQHLPAGLNKDSKGKHFGKPGDRTRDYKGAFAVSTLAVLLLLTRYTRLQPGLGISNSGILFQGQTHWHFFTSRSERQTLAWIARSNEPWLYCGSTQFRNNDAQMICLSLPHFCVRRFAIHLSHDHARDTVCLIYGSFLHSLPSGHPYESVVWKDLMFIVNPNSGGDQEGAQKWAAYNAVAPKGDKSFMDWWDDRGFTANDGANDDRGDNWGNTLRCFQNKAGNGYKMSAGNLKQVEAMCNTNLYFDVMDMDGTSNSCGSDEDSWGEQPIQMFRSCISPK